MAAPQFDPGMPDPPTIVDSRGVGLCLRLAHQVSQHTLTAGERSDEAAAFAERATVAATHCDVAVRACRSACNRAETHCADALTAMQETSTMHDDIRESLKQIHSMIDLMQPPVKKRPASRPVKKRPAANGKIAMADRPRSASGAFC